MCSGAGGGHYSTGGDGSAYAYGYSSSPYEVPRLSSSRPLDIESVINPLFLGQAGGRGAFWDGYQYTWTDGGAGGGLIKIFTPILNLTGTIAADGKQPTSSCVSSSLCSTDYNNYCVGWNGYNNYRSTCSSCPCGGGGAGGSVSIESSKIWKCLLSYKQSSQKEPP